MRQQRLMFRKWTDELKAAGAEPMGTYFNQATQESIFVHHNICVKCELQYPKSTIRCVVPECRRMLRYKSKKNKAGLTA